MILAPGLQDAMRPLAERRKAEGWEVTVITGTADPAPAMKQIAALAAQAGHVASCWLVNFRLTLEHSECLPGQVSISQ